MGLCQRVICPNNAGRMANSVDPDQTAPLGAVWRSSLIWVCAVCPGISVQKLRIITVLLLLLLLLLLLMMMIMICSSIALIMHFYEAYIKPEMFK